MEGSRTSDVGLDMHGPGLKVENGLGLRSLPDDFAFLEVRVGEFGFEKNPTHFFSMSGVSHASRRCSVLNLAARGATDLSAFLLIIVLV